MKKIFFSVFFVILTYIAFGQTWDSYSLNNKYIHRGVVSHDTKMFLAGGGFNGDIFTQIDIYDIKTQSWDHDHHLISPRMLPAGARCGNKVIFAGGLVDFSLNVSDVVDIYDLDKGEWTIEHLSVPRIVSAISHDNTVVFAGGFEELGALSNVIDFYNCATEEWSTDTMPVKREIASAHVVDDLAFFAGGVLNATKRVDIYNFKNNEWTQDSISVARSNLTIASIGNKILFAGGMTIEDKPSSIVDIYDLLSKEWTVANLSVPRAFGPNSIAPSIGSKVYFAGGGEMREGMWYNSEKTIDVYDYQSGEWSLMELPKSLVNHSITACQNNLMVAGGISVYSNGMQFPNPFVYIYIDPTVPQQEVTKQYKPIFYPNPASDYLNFMVNNSIDRIDKIRIYDSFGRTVLMEEHISGKLDITMLSPGIHYLQFHYNGEKIHGKLLVH